MEWRGRWYAGIEGYLGRGMVWMMVRDRYWGYRGIAMYDEDLKAGERE